MVNVSISIPWAQVARAQPCFERGRNSSVFKTVGRCIKPRCLTVCHPMNLASRGPEVCLCCKLTRRPFLDCSFLTCQTWWICIISKVPSGANILCYKKMIWIVHSRLGSSLTDMQEAILHSFICSFTKHLLNVNRMPAATSSMNGPEMKFLPLS